MNQLKKAQKRYEKVCEQLDQLNQEATDLETEIRTLQQEEKP